ncbi:MAG TPA: ATP-binding protein [Pyrinomonadaceae bacterium]|nr:ATP-binding protein [Pyrinomonadaceae bacterium]
MGKEDFIKDAHYKPNEYIAYYVGRELSRRHPEKAVLEGETGYFDLEAFVRAEKCAVVSEASVFNQIKTDWTTPEKELRTRIPNSWLNVLWKGQLLDVIFLTFSEGCYPTRHHWIVADSAEVAASFFTAVCEWSAEVRGEVLVYEHGFWNKSEELFKTIKSATFDTLILPDRLKQEIRNDFVQFLASREVYERYGIPWKRGVLLIGPPGNGKTHTVKALVNQLAQPCLYVRGFKSEYSTDQENIKEVFERARMTTPCIVVLEDLDSMIDENSRAFFLNELDGFETNKGIVVLATTNHPERLDPAILDRPSRFDRKYYFQLPGNNERTAYVAHWNEKLNAELQLSAHTIEHVVGVTEGFSFAYLKELFLSSMMRWTSTDRVESMDEIVRAQVQQLRGQMTNERRDESQSGKPSGKAAKVLRFLKR